MERMGHNIKFTEPDKIVYDRFWINLGKALFIFLIALFAAILFTSFISPVSAVSLDEIKQSNMYLPDIYILKDGKDGGQTLTGGTGSNEDLVLIPSSNSDVIDSFVQILGKLRADNFYTSAQNYTTFAGHNTGNITLGLSYNTNFGYTAGYQGLGIYQTAIGYQAGRRNRAPYQTAIGSGAGYSNTKERQTVVGYNAGESNTGLYETSFGHNAGSLNSGDYISSIGYRSGYNNTGDNLIAIGYQAGLNNQENSKFILKQNNINSNGLILGNFSSGIIQFPNYGAGTATFDAGGNISSVSDEKLKKNKRVYSSSNPLPQPIQFNYNEQSGLDTNNVYTGFSAQEVQKLYPECVFSRPDVRYETYCKPYVLDEEPDCNTKSILIGTVTLSVDERCLLAAAFNKINKICSKNKELCGES